MLINDLANAVALEYLDQDIEFSDVVDIADEIVGEDFGVSDDYELSDKEYLALTKLVGGVMEFARTSVRDAIEMGDL